MVTVVLVGLIYMICEMYIDNCSVFGDANIEFVARLRSVFERLRKHNLYLKANTCFFGFKEMDFVCKVLSEEELKISRTKIQSVLYFPLPFVSKQLKSFLATVNYLRNYVRNHSTIAKPLHDLIANYDCGVSALSESVLKGENGLLWV